MWHQDNDAHDKAVDSLTNFETVKYFTNEDYELRRYRESVALYQKHMFSTSVCARCTLNTSTGAVFLIPPPCACAVVAVFAQLCAAVHREDRCGAGAHRCCLSGMCASCAVRVASVVTLLRAFCWQVVNGDATVGDFVTMNVYIVQVCLCIWWLHHHMVSVDASPWWLAAFPTSGVPGHHLWCHCGCHRRHAQPHRIAGQCSLPAMVATPRNTHVRAALTVFVCVCVWFRAGA